jgi:hypothetical protein
MGKETIVGRSPRQGFQTIFTKEQEVDPRNISRRNIPA